MVKIARATGRVSRSRNWRRSGKPDTGGQRLERTGTKWDRVSMPTKARIRAERHPVAKSKKTWQPRSAHGDCPAAKEGARSPASLSLRASRRARGVCAHTASDDCSPPGDATNPGPPRGLRLMLEFCRGTRCVRHPSRAHAPHPSRDRPSGCARQWTTIARCRSTHKPAPGPRARPVRPWAAGKSRPAGESPSGEARFFAPHGTPRARGTPPRSRRWPE